MILFTLSINNTNNSRGFAELVNSNKEINKINEDTLRNLGKNKSYFSQRIFGTETVRKLRPLH